MAERKKYIEVNIPLLGETIKVLGTPENLHDKTIKLDMTRKLRGKGLTITFQIINIEGKLVAFPKKMDLVKSYIRKIMRKRSNYVEDSFVSKCEDIRATVKPLLITRKKVSRVVRKNLRNTSKEFIQEYLKDRTYIDLCNDLLQGHLQREMQVKLKKIYPLSFCDIRVFETKELEKIDLEQASQIKEEPEQDIQEIPEEVEEDIQGVPEEPKKEEKKEKDD